MKRTLTDLKNRMTVDKTVGYNNYLVTIRHRNYVYKCLSHNSLAYDMLDWEPGEEKNVYNSQREAWQALYDECRRKNNL